MNDSADSQRVRKTALVSGLVSAIVSIVLILVFGLAGGQASNNDSQSVSNNQLSTTTQRSATSSRSVVDVVNRVQPSVVSIVASKKVPQIERSYQPGPFGFYMPRRELEGFERQQTGSGSGFFVSDDGLLVTNRHVVADTEASYSAVTNDGQTHDLKVVDRSPFLDIALLRVQDATSTFPSLSFGSSSNLQPGQKVIAIGNALGEFQNSVSTGVVSGLKRSIVAGQRTGSPQRLERVIQTDVAINPGNSGGPLLNMFGEVVGVNVAIVQGSENISFALPATAVKETVQSVKKYGEIVRPFLGIRFVKITEEVASRRNLESDRGALVISGEQTPAVTPNSAADEAGIRARDIILAIGGTEITEDTNVSDLIRQQSVGDTVEITLLRDGQRQTVTAELQQAPDQLR